MWATKFHTHTKQPARLCKQHFNIILPIMGKFLEKTLWFKFRHLNYVSL
jgi:hypothetical protein